MNKVIKYLLVVTLITGLVIAIFYIIGLMAFSGAFDKKYSREELTKAFLKHDKEFSDVTHFFKDNIPVNFSYSVSFGISSGDKVSLRLYPHVIDPANKIPGAYAVTVESPEMDSLIKVLGWSKETVMSLRDRLSRTNCDWIRTVGDVDRVEMYPDQSGWGSFTYIIWPSPITDSLAQQYGRPIAEHGFGQFVTLSYSAAL